MAHPNIIYGSFGDEKKTAASAIGGATLGALMILPDGRKFRHAKASATAVVAGNVYAQNTLAIIAGSADADVLTEGAFSSGGAAGSATVVITLGGTAALGVNDLADGYLFVSSGTAEGETYKIKSNTNAAKSGTVTITLYPNDTFKTSIAAASSKYGVRQAAFNNLTVTTADTVCTGPLAGVAPVAASASYYFWIQRSGPATVLTATASTVIVGEPVCVSDSTAGAIEHIPPAAADTTGLRVVKQLVAIGDVLNAAASTKYALINLRLE